MTLESEFTFIPLYVLAKISLLYFNYKPGSAWIACIGLRTVVNIKI